MSDNNWIEWKGGECPVPKGTLVDLRYRDNYYEQRIAVPALTFGKMSDRGFWQHDSHAQACDIIAWRLHEPEQSAWNGEGLPPVGTECEACKNSRESSNNWVRVKIMYVSDFTVVMHELEAGAIGEEIHHPRTLEFRPIRTEAERKREETVKAIMQVIQDGNGVSMNLYDAIAAGKIPGIKLL